MKEGYCDKCKQFTVVETHHILPKSTFGENEETAKLCPTCHTLYHQKLGNENLKNPDPVFHFYFFYRWKYGLLGLLVIILMTIYKYL
jgi:hypothetical protein